MHASTHSSPGFPLPLSLQCNNSAHSWRPGTPGRVPRGHPRNSPASDLPCPITISPQEQVGFQAPCSSALGSQPPISGMGLGARGSVEFQHLFSRPALQTSLWFSVPPSISKDDPLGEVSVKEVKTKVSSTLNLECEYWAVPLPTISWYKDGQVSSGAPGGLRFSAWVPVICRTFH